MDNLNHPSHYETGQFECIDVMVETQGVEATMNFCVCNALKYIYRHKRKNGIEDIQKAIWYLNKAEELYKGEPIQDWRSEKMSAKNVEGQPRLEGWTKLSRENVDMDAIRRLAFEVIKMAVRDWDRALTKIPRKRLNDMAVQQRICEIEELRRFFRGEYCEALLLGAVTTRMVLETLEERYQRSAFFKQIKAYSTGESA